MSDEKTHAERHADMFKAIGDAIVRTANQSNGQECLSLVMAYEGLHRTIMNMHGVREALKEKVA